MGIAFCPLTRGGEGWRCFSALPLRAGRRFDGRRAEELLGRCFTLLLRSASSTYLVQGRAAYVFRPPILVGDELVDRGVVHLSEGSEREIIRTSAANGCLGGLQASLDLFEFRLACTFFVLLGWLLLLCSKAVALGDFVDCSGRIALRLRGLARNG